LGLPQVDRPGKTDRCGLYKLSVIQKQMNDVMQGLWIGPELSVMEQLSIASFLQNGHEYHLYVYDAVKNVPASTVVRDANEILPASRIFQYKHQASYAGFANFFRYKLLLERGGWWVDTDVICLKRFDFTDDYVFASEIDKDWDVIASGIIKAPAGSSVMAYAWEVCDGKDPQQLMWGETGPKLMTEAVTKFSLEHYIKHYEVFCPLGFSEWRRVLEPEGEELIHEDSHAIHLWNEMWRAAGQDKNATYDQNSLYERLKTRYL
jgi:mannosyltransferase OCH1-like enzyme